ncbi:CidA/LrgA family protein [Rhizobiaceae bacterium CRRU44]|uniref:CidA/LrgA family protein n=1 Tax=Ferranicluibacter rubi TaxID=2715133 RepID=A0AA43ZFI9_9HYPH|nr:CidA/LrgA family protein [Ferranicluibacter rubi]NHT76181.1 CidA/LrgA family protein [Ferranicluibacter rubi]
MIQGITWLLGFQLVGETLSYASGGHVPGPVIGLALLALFLLATRRFSAAAAMEQSTGKVADGLLANLGILFVPAGVGIIQHLDLVISMGLPILVAILVSTVVTLVVTVWAFTLAKHLEQQWRRKP